MWAFLIGMIAGCVIGIFLIALISAGPDDDGTDGEDDEV